MRLREYNLIIKKGKTMSADDLNIQNIDLDSTNKASLNQATEQQDDKKKVDTALATTVMLLQPALENMAQVYSNSSDTKVSSVQSPKDLFSSKVADTSSSTSGASGTDPSSTPASSASSGVSDITPPTQGLTTMSDWEASLKQILGEISHMPAGEALMLIMAKLLPFLGKFTQWQMSQEGVTMNLITQLNNDWSQLKNEFTQYGEGGPEIDPTTGKPVVDPSTGKEVWPTYDQAAQKYGWTKSPAEIIANMNQILQSNPSLESALGSSFTTQLKDVTGSSDPDSASNDSIMSSWADDWKSYDPGSGDEPSSNVPTQTVIDAFTSFTTSLNNQSSQEQGQFKQTSSDLNTYDQILAGTLKDTSQLFTYINQKMTSN
jgi:hypothetical protein